MMRFDEFEYTTVASLQHPGTPILVPSGTGFSDVVQRIERDLRRDAEECGEPVPKLRSVTFTRTISVLGGGA